MTSGSFRSVSRPRNRRKSQSARLRVLASQSKVALDRSETFLRNQDPYETSDRAATSAFVPLHRPGGSKISALASLAWKRLKRHQLSGILARRSGNPTDRRRAQYRRSTMSNGLAQAGHV